MMDSLRPCGMEQDLLQEYLDGELRAAERLEMDTHLAGCAACRAEVAGYRRLCERLALMPLFAPGADFDRVVLEAVFKRRREVLGVTPLGWLAMGYLVFTLGLAAVAMVLAGPPLQRTPASYFTAFWKSVLHTALSAVDQARDVARLVRPFVEALTVLMEQLRLGSHYLAQAAMTHDGQMYLLLIGVTALGFFRFARRTRKGGPIVHAAM